MNQMQANLQASINGVESRVLDHVNKKLLYIPAAFLGCRDCRASGLPPPVLHRKWGGGCTYLGDHHSPGECKDPFLRSFPSHQIVMMFCKLCRFDWAGLFRIHLARRLTYKAARHMNST